MEFINENTIHKLQSLTEPKLLIPILSDPKKHNVENHLSFVYIYTLQTWKEFIIGFNHNDTYGLKFGVLNDLFTGEVYCYKKKYLIDCRANLTPYEADLVVWFNTNKKIEVDLPVQVRQYWNWYPEIENINDSIPIMKWLEYCRGIKDKFILQYNNFEISESFIRYNQLLNDLEEIERNGLFIIT